MCRKCKGAAKNHGLCSSCRAAYDKERYDRDRQVRDSRNYIKKNPLYNTWALIKQRCYNPKCKDYKRYGAKGIKLYPEWIKSSKPFVTYIEKVLGPRPDGHTLDRINNEGDYKPGNLRWATQKEQIQNSKYGRRS